MEIKKKQKKRLDVLLTEKGIVQSRHKAQALIMAGKVFVNDEKQVKAGSQFFEDIKIKVKDQDNKYVSRGGIKLEKALEEFNFDVNDLTCLDVGSSTGGFSDCLLQHNARKVYAVDVGYGQMAWEIRNDPRVKLFERTNIRYMENDELTGIIDLATIDVSFISLKIVIPSILKFLKKDASIISLVKPQFEVGRQNVGKGGIVKNEKLHNDVLNNIKIFIESINLSVKQVIPSPILGAKGNKEFIMLINL